MFLYILLILVPPTYAMNGGGSNYSDGRYVGPRIIQGSDLSRLRNAPHYPGYRFSPGMAPNPDAGTVDRSSVPSIGADYNTLNSSLGDVNNILNGGTTGNLMRAAAHRSDAIQSLNSSAQSTRAEADRLNEVARQMAASQLPTLFEVPVLPNVAVRMPPRPGVIDLLTIPDSDENDLPFRFQSPSGQFRDDLVRQYKDLYKIQTTAFKRSTARDLGLSSTQEADRAYAAGNGEDAHFYKAIGEGMLDLAIGLDPITGFVRSTFELMTGRNIVTGAQLSSLERSFAFLGVMTLGTGNSAVAATRMFHVFEGTGRLLRERAAIQTAIREGEILAERVGHLLPGFTKNHRITNIHTAEHVNQTRFPHYGATPPFQLNSHVVEFKTLTDTQWVRVHGGVNQAKEWIVRKSAIEGLNAEEIARKFAIPLTPTHISDVHIPKGTTLLRGNIQDHGQGATGAIQYWIDKSNIEREAFEAWFKNMRTL